MSNPFQHRKSQVSALMRLLRRFTKAGGHWAEIRERTVTQFKAIEFIVYVDDSLLKSQMFHSGREVEYPKALEVRVKQFIDGRVVGSAHRDAAHIRGPHSPKCAWSSSS